MRLRANAEAIREFQTVPRADAIVTKARLLRHATFNSCAAAWGPV